MNTLPMISVIMPVYNAEKYVAEAVESILEQTYHDFELIIIDDCSSDSSCAILQNYVLTDKRIKLLINEENYKQAYAKNKAINIANGKYIVFMDADDISIKERFAKQLQYMESHPEIGVCGSWVNLFTDDIYNGIRSINFPIEHDHILIHMLFNENCIAHPASIIRKDLFIQHNLRYNANLLGHAEDYDLWIRALKLGIKFHNIPEYLLYYRQSDNQTMVTNKEIITANWHKIIYDNYIDNFSKYIEPKQLETFLLLKFTPKKKLSIREHLYFQYLIYLIKWVNCKYQLFEYKEFCRILDKDSLVNLVKRYIKNKL